MADTMVMLQLEHGTYWRLLDLLDSIVEQLELGHDVDTELISLIFEYFADYPEACHHPKEDVVFRQLELRDPEVAARVGDLLGEHVELSELTKHCVGKVIEARALGLLASPECLAQMREFSTAYRKHVQAEDQHFFKAVFETLNREDFDLIDFSMFEAEDPMFNHKAESRFIRLRRRIWDAAAPESKSAEAGGDA